MITYIKNKFERFLRVDAEYIARGGFWLASAKIFGLCTAFALSLLYARFVPKTVFGNYKYVLSLFGTFTFFALPGVGLSVTRSVAKGYDGSFRDGFKLIFRSSWMIAVLGLAMAAYFAIFLKNNDVALLVSITALLIPLMEGTGSWKGFYDGKRLFKTKAFWSIAQDALIFICVAGSVTLMQVAHIPTVSATLLIIVSVIGGQAIVNIVSIRYALKHIPTDAPRDPAMIPYGMHMTAATIPSAVANYIDGILLYAYLGPIQLAIYSFALLPANQIKELLNLTGSLAFPKFASGQEEHLKKELPKKLLRASIFTLLIVGTYIILVPYLYPYLFPLYTESIPYSQVFALSFLLSPLALLGTAIDASGSKEKMYIYRTAPPILQIAVLCTLIPSYGIWGAIVGRVIGRVFNQGLLFFLFRR